MNSEGSSSEGRRFVFRFLRPLTISICRYRDSPQIVKTPSQTGLTNRMEVSLIPDAMFYLIIAMAYDLMGVHKLGLV